jgi:hypothetical protein
MTATHHMTADAQLYCLAQTLRSYDGITTEMRDNKLHVAWQQGDRSRSDTITCSPRPSDFDHLWFWDSQRRPIREADMVPDAAMHIAGTLRVEP